MSKRKEDVLQIRNALELYYNDNGSYPFPYPGNIVGWGGVNSGTCGSGNGTTSGPNAYISGLTPAYISVLPVDPIASANCTGYLYHSDGVNYKLMIHSSYEGTYPTAGGAFYDPVRPTWALMLCSGEPGCSGW